MRTHLVLLLCGVLVCLVTARQGSISNSLLDDDSPEEAITYKDEDEASDIVIERRRNPCIRHRCYRGERCVMDKNQNAKCVCTPDCSYYQRGGERLQVCSNNNVTYDTDCHLDRDYCLCKRGDHGCSSPGVIKIQVDYYGPCHEITPCPDHEISQFPQRMRDWLYVVMKEMARRAEIGEYVNLLEEASKDTYHAYAVIWKFCDLDTNPQDRIVSRRELQYTVQTLKGMEHCLMPFLDSCDVDDDGHITLFEWGKCLELEDGQVKNLCQDITKHQNRQ